MTQAPITKRCSRCGAEKALEHFPRNNRPYEGRAGRKSYCKPCYVDHMRDYYARNPAKYQRLQERAREVAAANPERAIWRRARQRAREAGILFTIAVEDIPAIPEVCPALGIPIVVAPRGRHPGTASLDRVENSKGYVPGNVIVVSFRANELKRDATIDELNRLAAFYSSLK